MKAQLVAVLGLATLALPAFAQEEQPYDDEGSYFGDEAPPPPADDRAEVDVSADLATPGPSVSFDTFRDGLAPYGEWVHVPGYGQVWRPLHVAAGWRPYYYGRWEWTDEGWLWVSDEPWGWAAYHYGRWAYDSYYGWIWVPGYQWAPAWVTWRYNPDYIGWAPLGPGFSVYVTAYPVVFNWWTFVPCTRFVGVPVFTVAFAPHFVPRIFHATSPAPPRAAVFGAPAPAWGGPARPIVERRIGHGIAPVRVQPVASPTAIVGRARAGIVPIYRPELRPAPTRGVVAAPVPNRGAVVAPAVPNRGAVAAPAVPNRGAAIVPQPVRPAPRPPQQGVAPARPWGANAPRPAAPMQAPRSWQGGPAQSQAAPARPPAFAPARPPGGFAPAPAGGFAPRPHNGGQAQGGAHAPAPAPHRRD